MHISMQYAVTPLTMVIDEKHPDDDRTIMMGHHPIMLVVEDFKCQPIVMREVIEVRCEQKPYLALNNDTWRKPRKRSKRS